MTGPGDQLSTPAHAASVGLLRWGLRHGEEVSGPRSSALSGAVGSITNWLKGFLP